MEGTIISIEQSGSKPVENSQRGSADFSLSGQVYRWCPKQVLMDGGHEDNRDHHVLYLPDSGLGRGFLRERKIENGLKLCTPSLMMFLTLSLHKTGNNPIPSRRVCMTYMGILRNQSHGWARRVVGPHSYICAPSLNRIDAGSDFEYTVSNLSAFGIFSSGTMPAFKDDQIIVRLLQVLLQSNYLK